MRHGVFGVLGLWKEKGGGKGEQRGDKKGRQNEAARGDKIARGMRHVYCNLCSCI